jgi:hypothetical protein
MGRSVYDPAPRYVRCPECGGEYDDSGYYGSDPHVCEKEAKKRLRRIVGGLGAEKTTSLLQETINELAGERAAAEAKRLADARAFKEREIREAEEKIARLKKDLAEGRIE